MRAHLLLVPLIAWLTRGRYYLCRDNEIPSAESSPQQCLVCENSFDHEDISHCPSYDGAICSLCCALDARCGNQCRPQAHLAAQATAAFSRLLPSPIVRRLHSVTGHFLGIFIITGRKGLGGRGRGRPGDCVRDRPGCDFEDRLMPCRRGRAGLAVGRIPRD